MPHEAASRPPVSTAPATHHVPAPLLPTRCCLTRRRAGKAPPWPGAFPARRAGRSTKSLPPTTEFPASRTPVLPREYQKTSRDASVSMAPVASARESCSGGRHGLSGDVAAPSPGEFHESLSASHLSSWRHRARPSTPRSSPARFTRAPQFPRRKQHALLEQQQQQRQVRRLFPFRAAFHRRARAPSGRGPCPFFPRGTPRHHWRRRYAQRHRRCHRSGHGLRRRLRHRPPVRVCRRSRHARRHLKMARPVYWCTSSV